MGALPKRAKELSAVEVKRITAPGLWAVGGCAGLSLQVKPSGSRSWILRTRITGRRVELGLGPFPDVPLAMARDNARVLADRIRRGEGAAVLAERKAVREASAPRKTFRDACEAWLEGKLEEIDGEKNRTRYRSLMERYAYPALGDKPVADITLSDVADALRPAWSTKTETMTKLRERLEAVFAYAGAHGMRPRTDPNPAVWRGGLSAVLPAPGRISKAVGQPALPVADAPLWWSALRAREGTSARALELLALTAVRSGELRGMRWGEIDMEAGVWAIPADRMKMKVEHRVPLSPLALELLHVRRPENPALDALVFAAPRGGPLSDMAISMLMRRMHEDRLKEEDKGWVDARSGRPAVPHGLRSTARTFLQDHTSFEHWVGEAVLAHTVPGVAGVYARGDMFRKRAEFMAAWADHLAGGAASR